MQLDAPMPQLPLTFGCRIVFEAIDPTTGNPVSGVTITNPVVYGYDLSAGGVAPPVEVAPLWVPLPETPSA